MSRNFTCLFFQTVGDFLLNTLLFYFSLALIDKEQVEYLELKNQQQNQNIQCGVKPAISSSTARILNGESSKQVYPWMASILAKIAVAPQHQEEKGKDVIVASGGVIISNTAILTCGHCLCVQKVRPADDKGYFLLETCLPDPNVASDDKVSGTNQNRKKINEINIVLGKPKLDFEEQKKDFKYDKKIRAFLYKYEPPDVYDETFHTFSRNGDIGIVIKKDGFSLQPGKVVPICLPAPDVFDNKNGFDVTLAGWGLRYEDVKDEEGGTNEVLTSSCLTNEARLHPLSNPFERPTFIPCVPRFPKDISYGYCYDILNKFKVVSFSYNSELKFPVHPLHPSMLKDILLNNPENQKCAQYYQDAKNAWVNAFTDIYWEGINDPVVLNKKFEEVISRIEIRKNDKHGDVVDICYNVKAVGEYGICETDEDSPLNWGFCSRSCEQFNKIVPGSDEPYEKATFTYFDTAPPNTLFSGIIFCLIGRFNNNAKRYV